MKLSIITPFLLALLFIPASHGMDRSKNRIDQSKDCIDQTEKSDRKLNALKDASAILYALGHQKSPHIRRRLDPKDIKIGNSAPALQSIVLAYLEGDSHCIAILDETNGGHTKDIAAHCKLGPLSFATGSKDCTIKISSINPHNPFVVQCHATLHKGNGGHANAVTALAKLAPGLFASAAHNNIRIWQVDPHNPRNVQHKAALNTRGHRDAILAVQCLEPDQTQSDSNPQVEFVSVSRDAVIKTWRMNPADPAATTCISTTGQKSNDSSKSSTGFYMRTTSAPHSGLEIAFPKNKIQLSASTAWLLRNAIRNQANILR